MKHEQIDSCMEADPMKQVRNRTRTSPNRAEAHRNRLKGKREPSMVLALWNVTNQLGQQLQVRLTGEGKLEKKYYGNNGGWQPLGTGEVDLGTCTVKDVGDMLRAMEGIKNVKEQRV